jgi:hypothetical protein
MPWDHDLFLIFLFVIGLVLIGNVFATIRNGQTQKALGALLQSGRELTPETLKALEITKKEGDNLQGGIVLLAVALGIAVLATLLGEGVLAGDKDRDGVVLAIYGAAAIPGFIGIALILLHMLRRPKS